ncbi:MAG: LPXTG cell wall anchor domain-containing protein [Patescibacteria group bacterium]|jgi:LPXTG-motif cell wall-anchored protein
MIKIISFVILIILGVAFFIYGGHDDSPGAQLIGFLVVVTGIVFIIKRKKKLPK